VSGRRIDRKRDREIAAAYVSGLSLVACGVKFGCSRNGVVGALVRTGTPLRPVGRPPELTADAAMKQRYLLAGYGTNAIARDLGVSPGTVGRALERDGVELRSRAESARLRRQRELREERGEYPWAAEAAVRNRAGEPYRKLGREYGVSARTVKAAIERRGRAGL